MIFLSAIFGLVVGSFLNVVINRLKLKQTFNGRSHCPHCKTILSPLDLIPVVSFVFLKGKCRYCRKPISPQYPFVESVTAISFVLISLNQDITVLLLFKFILAAFLIVIAVYDFKHYIILDKVLFPATLVALLFVIYKDFGSSCGFALECAKTSGFLGALIISGFFFLQFLISGGRWIGFGDVKLGIFLGLISGFYGSILLLFIGYVLGAVVGLILIGMGNAKLTSKLAFGSILTFVALIVLIYGDAIIKPISRYL